MSTAADLDELFTRRATAVLSAQQEIYAQLLETLERAGPEASGSGDPRLLVSATRPLLRSLADQAAGLSGVVGRLKPGVSEGPRAESCRALLRGLGLAATEAHRRVEVVLGGLRADQARAREEINELDRATPAGYLDGGGTPALLVDRTG